MTDTNLTQKYQLTKLVCQLDDGGFYLNPAYADLSPQEEDKGVYLILAGCIDTAPPAAKPGQIARWQDNQWTYESDLRGQTVYSTTDGTSITITAIGSAPEHTTSQPRPSVYHTWTNGKWTLTASAKAQQLAAAKRSKLNTASQAAQAFIDTASTASTTPEFEVMSWVTQAAEAKAWHADNSTATPTLAAIAAARGVDVDVLQAKAYAKAVAYELLVANIAGQRQAIEDKINAAQDIAALNAIEIAFTVQG